MNFFFDNTFAPGLARSLALIAAKEGHVGKHLLDHWEDDPGDEVWIVAVGQWAESWIVLTGDRAIGSNPQKRAAILSSGRVVFFMPSGFTNLSKYEQAAHFFRWFPKIAKVGSRPSCKAYDVKMNGQIDPWP